MPASVAKKFADLKAETLNQWAGWAQSIADGGATPSPLAVLEAGAILGIPEPMEALEKDAAAISEVAALEWEANAIAERIEKQLAPYGGEAGLREKISAMRRELDAMVRIAGPEKWLRRGQVRGELGRLKARHPRVFPVAPPKPKAGARRREAAE